jgi:hypothetical protein
MKTSAELYIPYKEQTWTAGNGYAFMLSKEEQCQRRSFSIRRPPGDVLEVGGTVQSLDFARLCALAESSHQLAIQQLTWIRNS